jgi:ubiquinone/menaquinone biosynthesis C-methylase UbiE
MNVTETLSEQGRRPTGALGWITALTMPLMFTSLYRKVAARLHVTSDDDVLDVGCGSGDFLRRHAAHARRVAGADHSTIEITLARRRNRRRVAEGTAEFLQADATALPWPDDSFTAVTCNCVQCFDDPQRSLQEMRRVLRPGGRAVLVMQGRAERAGQRDRWGMPLWTKAEVEQMAADAGFSPVEVTADGDLWFVAAGKP